MEQLHQVTRLMSFDYLFFVTLLAVWFNIFLIIQKKWPELLVFNIAGGANLVIEILMVNSGARHFDTDVALYRTLALLCLGWVTNGFVFTVAYFNVKQWMKRTYPTRLIVLLNVTYFLVLPLMTADRGIFEGSVSTWREMGSMIAYVEPVALFVFASTIFALGYRKLLWRLLLIGFCVDLSFEGSLFLMGIRPMAQFAFLEVGERVLFEMNTFLCLGFLILKGIFRLEDYKDANVK